MRILARFVSICLPLCFAAVALDAAAVPAARTKAGPLSDREVVREQLASYFKSIDRNSPTVLGGLAKSPETMAEIQARIANLDDAELARIQKLMAETPDWKVAPEAFASAFPPEVLDQMRLVGADYAKQMPKGERMRDDVRTLVGVLKVMPDAKLAELGIDRKTIASLEATMDGMTPLQATMLQRRIEETSPWREKSATALESLPPALQRGAAALAEHGALTEKDLLELEQFRRELTGVMARIDKLPPSLKKNLNAEGLTAQAEQLKKAPPDILFMVRHNLPQENLRTLEANVALLERVSHFTKEETAELDQFRDDLAHAFKQIKGEGEAEWNDADQMLAGLGPEHLYLLRQQFASLGGWQVALPAVYQTLAASETPARMKAVHGSSADPAELQAVEAFRGQALNYIDAVASTPGLDPKLVARARKTIESAPPERLQLIRLTAERLPVDATPFDKLGVVMLNDTNFNCSLSMTAVPEVCVPEIGICPVCTPAFCTPAVTVTANFDVICDPIEDAIDAMAAGITSTANTAVETMRAGIQASLNTLQSTINASIASVNQLVATSVSSITDTVDNIWSFIQTIPDLAWSAIKSALNLLLDIEIRNGVTVRDLVASGAEQALNSMTTLLGLADGWWNAVSTFTLPQIPCPPAGFHTPFGDVGDGAASANYARYRLMIDNIVGMIPDTETSLAVKVPAQLTFMMFDFLGTCLEQASGDADAAELTSRHNLVMANFANMQTFVGAQISGLAANSSSQTTSLLSLLTTQNNNSQATVVTQSQAIQALLNSQSTTTDNLINTESNTIQSLLHTEGDSTRDALGKFRDLDTRVTIERALQAGVADEVASLQLLEPWGHLGLVKKIVEETIQSMTIAGEGVGLAQKYLDSGSQLMNPGKYKLAFREFVKAYKETTR